MFYDRVKQTTTSTGTGELELPLTGSTPSGFRSFITVWNGPITTPVRVAIVHESANEWEICDVTISAGSTPAPDVVTRSVAVARSAGTGDNVNFSAGTKYIFPVADAEWLNGVNANRRVFSIRVLAEATALTVADGLGVFAVPAELNGYNIVSIHAAVDTVSSSGAVTIQVYNATDTQDILSTEITIDVSEYTSYTAATAHVVDTDHDDLATGDRLRIDCDGAGTDTAGLTLHFVCQKP